MSAPKLAAFHAALPCNLQSVSYLLLGSSESADARGADLPVQMGNTNRKQMEEEAVTVATAGGDDRVIPYAHKCWSFN